MKTIVLLLMAAAVISISGSTSLAYAAEDRKSTRLNPVTQWSRMPSSAWKKKNNNKKKKQKNIKNTDDRHYVTHKAKYNKNLTK